MDSTLQARRPSQRRGTETVEALRKAAGQLLATKDYGQVTVADLARRARVGVGTFYHFYPSKEALLLDLREQLLTKTMQDLAEGFGRVPILDGAGLLTALERLITRLITMSQANPRLERAVAAMSFESPEFAAALRAQESQVQTLVIGLLNAYAPMMRPNPPEAAARALVILVEAVVARSMREPDLAAHPGPVVAEVAKMMARYLMPPRKKGRG